MRLIVPDGPDLDDVERRLHVLSLALGHIVSEERVPEEEGVGAVWLGLLEVLRDVRVLLEPEADLKKPNGEEG